MFYTREERDQLKQEHIENFTQWIEGKVEYTIIPDHIIFSDKLSDGEKMFYIKLSALSDKKKGILLHGNDRLAEDLNCSVSNIKKFLDSLKKKKAIITLSTGPHKYRIICLCPWNIL